jgi:2-(1,2-epoxy-1,2-dihydrophenyl)acetyl-CoA isomerase
VDQLVETELAGRVALVRLNKPWALNALCAAMSTQLLGALKAYAADPEIQAVLLTGNGRAFCGGSDLGAEAPVPGLSPSERGDLLLSQYFNPIVRTIHGFPKPVVVGINGLAVGGGVGLALSGDLAIASESAEFRLNFGPKLGLVPDMGCTWALPRLIGRARALGTAITGEAISARTAQEWGLIWAVVSDSEFDAEAVRLAGRLGHGPSEAFVAVRDLMDGAVQGELDIQLERERAIQTGLMGGRNFAEGIRAFEEKRDPHFE